MKNTKTKVKIARRHVPHYLKMVKEVCIKPYISKGQQSRIITFLTDDAYLFLDIPQRDSSFFRQFPWFTIPTTRKCSYLICTFLLQIRSLLFCHIHNGQGLLVVFLFCQGRAGGGVNMGTIITSLFSLMLLWTKQFPLAETRNCQNFLKVALLSSGVTPATVLLFRSVTAKTGHLP